MAIDSPPDDAVAHERAGQRGTGTPVAVASQPVRERITVDGIDFDALREHEVVAHVVEALSAGRGGVVVTPNVDILRQLRTPAVGALARDADLVVPDGMPIVWASRILGTELPERVTGSSLVWSLSRAAAADGRSVFLLGGAPGVAERAGQHLVADIPGLRVAGHACPPLGFEKSEVELERLRAQVRAAAPDLVFVALGFPKQERLSYLLRQDLPGAWFVGCGGTLTMVAGHVSRAPEWAQRSGLEWLHRLAQEPGRMARRYLVDDAPYAVGLLVRSLLTRRRRRERRA
jgi:N-acetylglucosaminyldiphosphoundecaprenol N-acetyl-beta-D-mannosaminyltransferase